MTRRKYLQILLIGLMFIFDNCGKSEEQDLNPSNGDNLNGVTKEDKDFAQVIAQLEKDEAAYKRDEENLNRSAENLKKSKAAFEKFKETYKK